MRRWSHDGKARRTGGSPSTAVVFGAAIVAATVLALAATQPELRRLE